MGFALRTLIVFGFGTYVFYNNLTKKYGSTNANPLISLILLLILNR